MKFIQKKSQWCWAAVTSKLVHYYTGEFELQEDIVKRVLKCSCENSSCGACNTPIVASKVLKCYGLLMKSVASILKKEEVDEQLKIKKPLVIAVRDGQTYTGHLLILIALEKNQYKIWDSRLDEFEQETYEGLIERNWVNTFTTKKPETLRDEISFVNAITFS